MAKTYSKSKGRRSSDGFLALPKTIIGHKNFCKLSPYAVKLLVDLGQQYIGKNNGDLCATWVLMRERGWKSKETLNNSIKELLYYGLLVKTQQGGLNLPSLYALGWNRIDKVSKYCDWNVGDRPTLWKQDRPNFRRPKKKQVRLTG